jgi:hypothetical protein
LDRGRPSFEIFGISRCSTAISRDANGHLKMWSAMIDLKMAQDPPLDMPRRCTIILMHTRIELEMQK